MRKRLLPLLLCAACALSLAACGAKEAAPAPAPEAPGARIANPFVDYATLAEAEADAGFTLSAPARIDGWDDPKVQLMNGKMLQLIFRSGDDRLIIRKQSGTDDCSGDYNSYPETKTAKINGSSVTLKGADGKYRTAVWTANGWSYAVVSDVPMAPDILMDLIVEIA